MASKMDTKSDKKAAAPAAKPAAAAVAAARPLITVYGADGKQTKATIKTPNVLLAPIRPDIVHFVHTSMSKNRRQAYAVSYNTGMQHSAESWGTGRAVARVPRISGGGTSRAGQGAFGNQVRGGRMFAPTKIWRKWHRKINQNQKRYAVASALAASALTALVQARGHRVDGIPEVPLVVADSVQDVTKTKQAIKVLEALNAYADVEKAKASRKLRAGKGKLRNRRHVQRRGPLVVFEKDNGITRAFRNLPGVELAQVDRLNLLQLAPGGHLGRFVIWTQSALKRLDDVWGSVSRESTTKTGYTLPRPIMIQSDLTRLINSDEVQSKVRPAIKEVHRAVRKRNPLTNLGALVTLNPYALALRRSELLTSTRRAAERKDAVERKRKGEKVGPTKHDAPRVAAEKKANKKHAAVQTKNYARQSGAGQADRKPVVPEDPVAAPAKVDDKKKPAGAAKPAAAAATGTKPAAAAAAPAADKPAPAAAPAAKPAADKPAAPAKEDKKAGGDKPKGKDAKGDGKDAKKGGDKPKGDKPAGDKPAKGGDKPKGDKPKGDKPAGDKAKGGDKKGKPADK